MSNISIMKESCSFFDLIRSYQYKETFYPYEDKVFGLYSRHFDYDDELLSSQYLELDVDSFRDCRGNE